MRKLILGTIILLLGLAPAHSIIIRRPAAGGGGADLSDTFDRANNGDIDALSTGMGGSLANFNYTEVENGCTDGWEINTNELMFDVTGNNDCDNAHQFVRVDSDLDSVDQWCKIKFGGQNQWEGSYGCVFRTQSGAGVGTHVAVRCNTATCTDARFERATDSTFGEALTATTDCDSGDGWTTIAENEWVGFSIEGTGNDTVYKTWDFASTSDPGDYSTWGTPTCTMTNDPVTPVDTGNRVGLKVYTGAAANADWLNFEEWAAGDI